MPTLSVIPALSSLILFAADPASAAVAIFSDNFNAPDTNNLDTSDQTGRRSGLLANDIQVRSSRIQHGIIDNQLNFLPEASGSGRIRFHSTAVVADWWNFASGAAGTAILADGGLRVSFDWTAADATSDNWVSFTIGNSGQSVPEPNVRVNHPGTDLGILFRNNGLTQYFDNGTAALGGNFVAAPSREVVMDFAFGSFANGTNVSLTASVNGQEVLSDFVFQWDDNNGALFMELGNLATGTRIDNLSISSIPEPSSVMLLSFGVLGVLLRKRSR